MLYHQRYRVTTSSYNNSKHKVRKLCNYVLKENQCNSVILNLLKVGAIPPDIAIHRYRGSIEEKIRIVQKFKHANLNTLGVQDGNWSLRKKKLATVMKILTTKRPNRSEVSTRVFGSATLQAIIEWNQSSAIFMRYNETVEVNTTLRILFLAKSFRNFPNFNNLYYDVRGAINWVSSFKKSTVSIDEIKWHS